jgi:hypothetical protein
VGGKFYQGRLSSVKDIGHGEKRPSLVAVDVDRVTMRVASQWYIVNVQQYNALSDEHLLQYPGGDTKYVHIGEDQATNVEYREYLRHISSMNDSDGINNNINEIKETCVRNN